MKEQKDIFLKVDSVEPVFKEGMSWSKEDYLAGIRVWIGVYGYFFPCDQWTICEPDAVREDGRSQVRDLAIELTDMDSIAKKDLFGATSVKNIFLKFPYEAIKDKLDAWKKEKDEIRVRDEVYSNSYEIRFVVTKIFVPSGNEDATANGLKKDGTAVKGLLLCNLKKTGLHVDDLDSYLEM